MQIHLLPCTVIAQTSERRYQPHNWVSRLDIQLSDQFPWDAAPGSNLWSLPQSSQLSRVAVGAELTQWVTRSLNLSKASPRKSLRKRSCHPGLRRGACPGPSVPDTYSPVLPGTWRRKALHLGSGGSVPLPEPLKRASPALLLPAFAPSASRYRTDLLAPPSRHGCRARGPQLCRLPSNRFLGCCLLFLFVLETVFPLCPLRGPPEISSSPCRVMTQREDCPLPPGRGTSAPVLIMPFA